MMRFAVLLLCVAAALSAQITNTYAVQTPATRQILLFSATGTGRTLSPASIRGFGVVSHTIQWIVTGAPAACTLDIEYSTDASSWSTVPGGSRTCTSGGSYSFPDVGYLFIGVNLSAFSGGTAPTITAVYQGTGATGQIPLPTTLGGTEVIGPFTDGSIVFAGASGAYSQNNANFYWDRLNARLGLGTAAPSALLSVANNFTVTAAGVATGKSSIFTATSASTVTQILNAAAAQSAAILSLRNSSGNALASYDATANPHLASGKIMAWSSSATDSTTTKDTGLSRNAAGIVEVNNGTATTYRDLKLRHTLLGGTAPTIASGFGTTPAIAGADSAGRVTVGSGGIALTGAVTFGTTWTTAPSCVCNNEVTTLLCKATATTTTLTMASASAWTAADTLTWLCSGY
jgi:hypothetical protein